MAKVALVIGVSEYEPGLNPLPSAIKDTRAIERILQHPEMCGFLESDIRVLENPDRQGMAEAIETLFANRQPDDLVLFFFSGHGIKDEQGKLYLSTCKTRKSPQGELLRSTAIPAHFVQESMSRSRSKRQVIILDCCFSGAFAEGLSAKDDGAIDVKSQLGGEGRAVLTSSTSTQYSFEQRGANLSIYTRYLVEGIETGAADRDNSGTISVSELHEYAKRKVQETAPAMKPEIYAVKEGFKILLAKASTADPCLKYRKEVEQLASRGEISEIARKGLAARRLKLGLTLEAAAAIEADVLKPYQEYKQRLHQYEGEFSRIVQQQYPLSTETRNDLHYLQQALGLRPEDIAPFEKQVIKQRNATTPATASPGVLPPLIAQFPETLATKSQKPFGLVDREGLPALNSIQRWWETMPLRQPTLTLTRGYQRSGLIAGGILATGALIGASIYAYAHIQQQRMILAQAQAQQASQNYPQCIELANQVRTALFVGAAAVTLAQDCRNAQMQATDAAHKLLQQQQETFEQARTLIAKGALADAIAHLQQIPDDSAIAARAQALLQQCAEQLGQVVDARLKQGNLNEAIALAAKIPQASAAYTRAQQRIQQWRAEEDANQQHWQQAQQALEQGDWSTALQAGGQITDTANWAQRRATMLADAQQMQAQAMQQQAEVERQQTYEALWETAQQHLAQGEPDNAMTVVQGLPDSPPWQERKEKIIADANVLKRKQAICQRLSLGLATCHQ